jgi:heptosyltransferase-1
MRVLIVKVSALGDVVHALPVLAWLKSADPGMEIDWLVEESFAPLLEGHPLIRRVHRLATKAWRRQGYGQSLRGGMETVRTLRAERYDVALDLQGNSKSGLFTRFSGAPLRYGFARDGVREWPNLLATNRHVPLSEPDYHVSERTLAVARAAFPGGSARPLAGPLPVVPVATEAVEQRLRETGTTGAPLVVLHYGTTWTTKLWPLDRWCDLAAALRRRGVRPVLTWGNDAELGAVRQILQACHGQAVVWPRGSLPELVALLARADLVIGGDTGPVHIAAAVGTPTVSLYRVTDARRNGPRGEQHIRLQAPLDCSPCLRKACERDTECGDSIAVGDVLRAVARLLPPDPSRPLPEMP